MIGKKVTRPDPSHPLPEGAQYMRFDGGKEPGKAPAKKARQCTAVYVSHRRGTVNTVFCEYREGHEGEHKGFRKRWSTP
jgi:hypothetical protein